ncbi:MAG: hypothetical protein ACRD0P_05120 [Stackebrandtia sp.]
MTEHDTSSTARAPDLPRRELIGAWLLLTGYGLMVLAFVWDQQWHFDVGPDNFFTAPHMMMYTGTATIGLTSLFMVLARTWRREDRPTSGAAVTVFRIFRAPAPFLVGGASASAFLVYGVTDLWWHTIYGFDLQGASWAHNGLLLSMGVAAVATVMAFAAWRGRGSARWGFAIAGGIGVAGSTITVATTADLSGVVFVLAVAGLCGFALALFAGVTRSPAWLLAIGAVFTGFQLLCLAYSPLATRIYADLLDQPLRDNARGVPSLVFMFPAAFPVVAGVAAWVVWLAKRRGTHPPRAMALIGAVAGIGGGIGIAVMAFTEQFDPLAIAVVVATPVCGAVAARFGWQCAALLPAFATGRAA